MWPMQSRLAWVRINELPKFLAEDPNEKNYSIIVNNLLNLNEPLFILEALKGATSYFPSWNTRVSEYKYE